jgi:hypothetical protein
MPVSDDKPTPPNDGKALPPHLRDLPPRGRAFTLPDDGAIEEARKLSELLARMPGEDPRITRDQSLPPAKPSRPEIRFSMSALQLADDNGEDEPSEDIELDFDEDEAPARPTEPAPADYASSAQKAVDGTISLGEKMNVRAASVPSERQAESAGAMNDLIALGDYTGALELAEARLVSNPSDAEALDVRDQCQTILKQMYSARLGSLQRVPVIMVPPEQLRWMSIDQRAAFMLHNIDGISTLEMILDVSGMPMLDAMRILTELVQQRVIAFR